MLEELFELARWAPNHNLTNPWRFRVLGPQALAALKEAAGPEAAAKLDRAPTLIAASVLRSDDDPVTDEEDFAAAAAATFIVLLGAHARGLGGYWRTPAVLRTPEGRAALGIPAEERVLGLHPPRPHQGPGQARARARPGRRDPLLPSVMLPRPDAVHALASEEFDVLVIGGGITGAGVALDAATRGYSVALVEKSDYAAGTSSRSSKLVHGGLRYLQNFDLGLVREALLERQINAALAPHLVRPLPMIVPAFEGARPDRLIGLGLNMYDVMAVDRLRRSPLGRRRIARPQPRRLGGLEPGAPPHHRRRRGARAAARARAARARPAATCSTTARPTTCGSC